MPHKKTLFKKANIYTNNGFTGKPSESGRYRFYKNLLTIFHSNANCVANICTRNSSATFKAFEVG